MPFEGDEGLIGRRRFLAMGGGAIAVACGILPASARAASREEVRRVAFDHLHTGEKARVTYWERGRYLPDALAEVDTLLRDHRTNEVHEIDPDLLDLLHVLGRSLDEDRPYEVICGFRSSKTNAALRNAGRGVASKSLHLVGKAIDIRVPGRSTEAIREAAWNLQRGGVGHYPRSGFVHVDTGRVRFW